MIDHSLELAKAMLIANTKQYIEQQREQINHSRLLQELIL
jgi:hypothetical protein